MNTALNLQEYAIEGTGTATCSTRGAGALDEREAWEGRSIVRKAGGGSACTAGNGLIEILHRRSRPACIQAARLLLPLHVLPLYECLWLLPAQPLPQSRRARREHTSNSTDQRSSSYPHQCRRLPEDERAPRDDRPCQRRQDGERQRSAALQSAQPFPRPVRHALALSVRAPPAGGVDIAAPRSVILTAANRVPLYPDKPLDFVAAPRRCVLPTP